MILSPLSLSRPYAEWLRLTDSIDELVEEVMKFRTERGLPVLKAADYKGRFWDKSEIADDDEDVTEKSRNK